MLADVADRPCIGTPRNPLFGMNPILAFVATAYALSVALSLIVGLTGGPRSPIIGLAYLSMFLPAISVAIVGWATREAPHVHWNLFPLRYLPLALFLMPGILQTPGPR